MESGTVRRRTSVIAAHLVSHDDISATATHVLPMSCSNGLSSVIRRCDNRTNFARQGSNYQGCFMRQASTKQDTHLQPGMPFESNISGNTGSHALEPPLFAKPAQVEPGVPFIQENQSMVKGFRYSDPSSEAPIFACPNRTCADSHFQSQKRSLGFASNGYEWSPRMDVADSGLSYVVTLEIPGVAVDNIKVEVNNQSLVVTGNRANWTCERAMGCSNKSDSTYHKKEIFQGPYRIVWPLPNNANKDHVSAEIQDGLLRVSIPKLSGLRWLRKTYM